MVAQAMPVTEIVLQDADPNGAIDSTDAFGRAIAAAADAATPERPAFVVQPPGTYRHRTLRLPPNVGLVCHDGVAEHVVPRSDGVAIELSHGSATKNCSIRWT
jgi:thiamine monophosphate kinase